jgi:transposase
VKQFIRMVVRTTQTAAGCRTCRQPSRRIHSRYRRTLSDLPWQGMQVRLRLHSRKFFCSEPGYPKAIFTERLPSVAAPDGRRTGHLSQLILQPGLALGEAGAGPGWPGDSA